MKRTSLYMLLLAFLLLPLNLVNAKKPGQNNQIPYPANYITTESGASSAQNMGDYEKSPYFAQFDFYNMKSSRSLTILEKFKTYQQTTEWSCGNAAAVMVLHYFDERNYQELDIAKKMGTNPLPKDNVLREGILYGTTTAGIVKFFKEIGYDVKSSLEENNAALVDDPIKFQAWVTDNLKNKKPIMVDWLDWSGHWQVIIGYDTLGTKTLYDDVIILADPYDIGDHQQDGYYIFPALRFYYMWHDFQYQPHKQQIRQWVIAVPK